MPLLDTHAITLQLLLSFIFGNEHDERVEIEFYEFINRLTQNIVIRKRKQGMFPELYGNRKEVAKSLYKKSAEYQDSSSLFLMTLVEIVAWMDAEPLYLILHEIIEYLKEKGYILLPLFYESNMINK